MNALETTTKHGKSSYGDGGNGAECQPINPHYRSEGRRQGSGAVFGAKFKV